MTTARATYERVPTGIDGLDDILHGGLPAAGTFLAMGDAGSGKTTLGLQLLLAGRERGERGMFLSLAQTPATLERVAASHGWSLDDIEVRGITPDAVLRRNGERQDVFVPEDVELIDLSDHIREVIGEARPELIVFDSLTILQILASRTERYRQELIGLFETFRELDATCLCTVATDRHGDWLDAEVVSDGTVRMERWPMDYGSHRYRLAIGKLRASDFRGGYHDFDIRTGGLVVYPRLVPETSGRIVPRARFESGSRELDELVGGGLAAGTSCLIIGPSGTGKTSLATQYAYAAAERGERSAIFLFEEVLETFLMRSEDLDMGLTEHVDSGLVKVHQIEGSVMSPGAFSVMVRDALDDDPSIIIVDSLTGYFQSMHQERTLLGQIRDLIRYVNRRDVLMILTVSQRGLVGSDLQSPLDISESADTALLLRYFESRGTLRKALSVMKKRYGFHRTDIRELMLTEDGLEVGPTTRAFTGILSGTPEFVGESEELMDSVEGG